MTELTVSLPDDLAARLSQREEQLPQIIERGLRQIESTSSDEFTGVRDVLEQLASLPSPETVLEMRAAPELQERVSELLEKNRSGDLTESEARELAEFELVEHIVRVAKGSARAKLNVG